MSEIKILKKKLHNFIKSGKLDQAEALISNSIATTPNNVDLYLIHADLKKQKGDIAGMETLCQTAVNIQPENINALFNFANSLFLNNKGKLVNY